jgi:2-methylcitrate dehydratase PrpD
MRVTSMLAEFIGKHRFEDCPTAAVDAARRAIVDCLGVMLAGSVEPAARIVQTVAKAEGGAPLATIVGTGFRTGGVWAALANGTAAHALDFDDTNFAMLGHPSAPVLAAALAAGELALADGRDLVQAFLLGFEVETTVAEAINPAHYEHGWHSTCTLGTLGAAAAASRLLGLDVGQTATALAVAASQSSGLKENFGTMTKPFHAGHAARSGLLAALLAREGWTASEQALEGPQGFLHVFSAGRRELAAIETLGEPWKILTTGVAVKPYPSCACTHSIIDGALELRQTHALRPEQIASVTIGVNRAVPGILIHSNPTSGLAAKFSGEFCAAAALVEGRVGMATFSDERVGDPEIRRLMARVAMEVDPAIPGELERHMWTRVTVRLTDGRALSIGPRPVPGHPGHPLPPAALQEKFTECAGLVLPPDRVGALAAMLEQLEACPDLRSLMAILGP